MAFFKSLGTAITAYQERAARTDQIARLQSKSNDELAAMGIERDRIVHHVYRDLMGL